MNERYAGFFVSNIKFQFRHNGFSIIVIIFIYLYRISCKNCNNILAVFITETVRKNANIC